MRIVQISPDYVTTPPEKYGGIERIVYELTEQLIKKGHEVFLYALPGSKTNGRLIEYKHWGEPLEIARYVKNTLPSSVDIIHDHTHGSVVGRSGLPVPTVSTIHVPWCFESKDPVFMSNNMRMKLNGGRGHVVPNGINREEYVFSAQKSNYLLFLGRLIESKGILKAIEIAEKSNLRLVIAGPETDIVDPETSAFYIQHVLPKIRDNPNIIYVGEVGGAYKQQLLNRAKCLLFMSEEEAFGLVMIEAMACGTPVLALQKGSVSEILSGFPELICRDESDAVLKLRTIDFPTPHRLRKYFLQNFTSEIMVDNYLKLYKKVLNQN
ncbi:glycosyltransferase [Paenibacillus segetis]|uniref:Glycosyl transferase n=1 Tax=Paenibacillus segetis TaxID=1325360 RepID=A0ABQ1YPN2_9BACL|nr:glycosyltransferase [Paenibacillus segetis]GGH33983.1 glycosyl transferase [Paenibacillus segetis]